MKVWIDQDLCTGDGLCEEIAPDVFTLLDDGLAYVKEGATIYACRFAMGALYGFGEDNLIPGVKAFNPLDVLDSALTAWRNKAFQLNTWTV